MLAPVTVRRFALLLVLGALVRAAAHKVLDAEPSKREAITLFRNIPRVLDKLATLDAVGRHDHRTKEFINPDHIVVVHVETLGSQYQTVKSFGGVAIGDSVKRHHVALLMGPTGADGQEALIGVKDRAGLRAL